MKLKLKKFCPATVSDTGLLGCFIVLIGRRDSGKLTLMKYLLGRMSGVDIVIGVSPTDDTNQLMTECIPKAFVFRKASEDFLKKTLWNLSKKDGPITRKG